MGAALQKLSWARRLFAVAPSATGNVMPSYHRRWWPTPCARRCAQGRVWLDSPSVVGMHATTESRATRRCTHTLSAARNRAPAMHTRRRLTRDRMTRDLGMHTASGTPDRQTLRSSHFPANRKARQPPVQARTHRNGSAREAAQHEVGQGRHSL